jgi:hypothetical protein
MHNPLCGSFGRRLEGNFAHSAYSCVGTNPQIAIVIIDNCGPKRAAWKAMFVRYSDKVVTIEQTQTISRPNPDGTAAVFDDRVDTTAMQPLPG